jgi:hypothetical protein
MTTRQISLGSLGVLLLLFLNGKGAGAENKVILESMKLGDKTVNNVRVTKETPIEVSVVFEGGGASLKRQDLPPQLRALYPYDAKAAGEYEKQQQEEQFRIAAKQKQIREGTDRARKADLQKQRENLKQRQAAVETELQQTDQDLKLAWAKARGRPRSPERQAYNRLLDQKQNLETRRRELGELRGKIDKQLDALP